MNSTQLFKTWSSFKALQGDFEYLIVFIDEDKWSYQQGKKKSGAKVKPKLC